MKRSIFLILVLLIILISFTRYIHRAPKRNYSDFHVLYVTAQRFVKGEDIYTFKKGVSYYKYPPFYAFLISPLAYLDEYSAALLWHLINWIFIITIFYSWIRILNIRRSIFFTLAVFLFSFRFLLENLDQGQANISFLAFTTVAFYFYFQNQKNKSSFFFALSILTKYLSVLFLPFFFLRRDYRFFFKTIICVLFLYFSPILILGKERMFHLTSQNLTFLFQSSLDKYSITCYPNQSLLACLRRLFSKNCWYPVQLFFLPDSVIPILFLIIGLVLLLFSYRKMKDKLLNVGLLSIMIPLLNPNGWKNSFIWLLIPYAIMFKKIFEEKIKDRVTILLIILSFIFTSLTSEFFVYSWAKDWFEIHSFVTWGALFLYIAFLKLESRNV